MATIETNTELVDRVWDEAIEDGEMAVVDRYRMRGTHEGEFRGIPPTGAEVEFTGIIIHHLEDGEVVEDVAEFDALDVMEQLGVVESPGD